jgi:hypothetical protein
MLPAEVNKNLTKAGKGETIKGCDLYKIQYGQGQLVQPV